MSPKLKNALVIFGPLVLGIGAILFINRKKKQKMDTAPVVAPGEELKIPVQAAPPPQPFFPLQNGSNNVKVKELQSAIGATVDGAFGPKTEAALVAFAGVRSVDTQEQLDEIKKKAQGSTNLVRATDLFNRFKKGGQAIYVVTAAFSKQVVVVNGVIIPTGKGMTLFAGKVYNNTDYTISSVTKTGNILVTVTRGSLLGIYVFDPNNISLKSV